MGGKDPGVGGGHRDEHHIGQVIWGKGTPGKGTWKPQGAGTNPETGHLGEGVGYEGVLCHC